MADAAGKVRVILSADAANFSAALDKAKGKLVEFDRAGQAAGHGTVSSMQAASGAIRLVEGDITRNVRAVERFITTIPGVGKALQLAFPLIGATAFIGVIARVGEQIASTIKKIQQMPEAVREGFRTLNESSIHSIDSLRVTNDKLEQSIALLEHKPVNNVALALDEARVNADELAASLSRDYLATKKLFDANQNGFLAQLMGKDSTTDVTNAVVNKLANIRTLADMQQDALHPRYPDGTKRPVTDADTKLAASFDAKILKAQNDAIALFTDQIAARSQGGTFHYGTGPRSIGQIEPGADANGVSVSSSYLPEQALNIEELQAGKSIIQDQQDIKEERDRNAADVVEQKRLADEKKQREEALAALDKFSREQVDLMRKSLDAIKANQETSLNQEASYWIGRAAIASRGGAEYAKVLAYATDEANKLMGEQRADTMRKRAEFDKQSDERISIPDLSRELEPEKTQAGAAVEYLKNLDTIIEATQKNADAMAAYRTQANLATGQISRYDAAQQQTALHTQEWTQYLDAAAKAIAAIQGSNVLTQTEKNAAVSAINKQYTVDQGARDIQVLEDDALKRSATVAGAMETGIGQMVQSWTDSSKNIVDLFESSVNTFNDALVKIATSKNPNVSKTLSEAGRSIFSEATKKTFQAAEGYGLQALGLGGKGKMGTPGNPMYVKVVEDAAAKAGGALGKILGIGSGGDGSQATQKHSWWRSLLGAASAALPGTGAMALSNATNTVGNLGMLQQYDTSTLPMLAGGGPISANQMAIVGESGPELVRFGSNANVYSNRRSMAMMSGGSTHYYTIDARGTDPVLTEIRTRQAIIQAHNSAIANSQRVQAEHVKRTPARAS